MCRADWSSASWVASVIRFLVRGCLEFIVDIPSIKSDCIFYDLDCYFNIILKLSRCMFDLSCRLINGASQVENLYGESHFCLEFPDGPHEVQAVCIFRPDNVDPEQDGVPRHQIVRRDRGTRGIRDRRSPSRRRRPRQCSSCSRFQGQVPRPS